MFVFAHALHALGTADKTRLHTIILYATIYVGAMNEPNKTTTTRTESSRVRVLPTTLPNWSVDTATNAHARLLLLMSRKNPCSRHVFVPS